MTVQFWLRVQQQSTGLHTVSLPRARVLRIRKGDVMEWLLEDGKLLLVRVKE